MSIGAQARLGALAKQISTPEVVDNPQKRKILVDASHPLSPPVDDTLPPNYSQAVPSVTDPGQPSASFANSLINVHHNAPPPSEAPPPEPLIPIAPHTAQRHLAKDLMNMSLIAITYRLLAHLKWPSKRHCDFKNHPDFRMVLSTAHNTLFEQDHDFAQRTMSALIHHYPEPDIATILQASLQRLDPELLSAVGFHHNVLFSCENLNCPLPFVTSSAAHTFWITPILYSLPPDQITLQLIVDDISHLGTHWHQQCPCHSETKLASFRRSSSTLTEVADGKRLIIVLPKGTLGVDLLGHTTQWKKIIGSPLQITVIAQAYVAFVPATDGFPAQLKGHFTSCINAQKQIQTYSPSYGLNDPVSYTHLTLPTILRV